MSFTQRITDLINKALLNFDTLQLLDLHDFIVGQLKDIKENKLRNLDVDIHYINKEIRDLEDLICKIYSANGKIALHNLKFNTRKIK